jgi:hypothetical protein
MNAYRIANQDPPLRPQRASRLEDAGFGSTLAVMALAVGAHLAFPVIREGGGIAQWIDNCMTVARAIASSAMALVA